jgi:ATP-dependent Clp protease adaptor protein ClpS
MTDHEIHEEFAIDDVSESATSTLPSKKPSPPQRDPKMLPPYKVLLHNDEKNTFEHVIRSVVRLTPIREDDAIVKAIEAHESGVSLLLVTHQERAELYAEQFASLSITITIEPDDG